MTVTQVGTPLMAKVTGTASGTLTATWNGTQTRSAANLLVAVVNVSGSTTGTVPAAPSGWTLWFSVVSNSREAIGCYTRVAAGADAAPAFAYTTTGTAAQAGAFAELYVLQDSSGGTPLLNTWGTATGTSGTVTPATTGNITQAGEFAIACCGYQYTSSAAFSFTTPSGWTAAPNDAATAYPHFASFYLAGPATGAVLSAAEAHGTSVYAAGAIAAFAPPQNSPALEASAFGTFTGIGPSDAINNVTASINQWASTAAMGPPTYQLWDGATAQIGSAVTGSTALSAANLDTATFTGVTYSQLGTLRLRIYAHSGTAPTGAVQSVDYVSLTVYYIPAGGAGPPLLVTSPPAAVSRAAEW